MSEFSQKSEVRSQKPEEKIAAHHVSPIMLQGTSSHVGKSILTAALCRIFREDGLKVAPFKAQNMALNSFVTLDGGEIGRAQAFQAEAAGIEPSIDMNPILLKPTSDMGSQVIIHGRVYGNMSAREYHRFKKKAKQYVMESYSRLSEKNDVIVIEGAGSPAEINLRENDIANMGLAEMIDAPVILIGDIDRGGVFASLIGTMELLTPAERKRVQGFIINKFRGDIELLKPGLDFLENKTGLPLFGVVPYLKDIILPDEDGVALERSQESGVRSQEKIRIAVIKLPRISNFTDFDAFRFETDVALRYVTRSAELDYADAIIIPGSKNTIEDLLWLWETGIANQIINYAKNGGRVISICGGFQMMGKAVKDPYSVESSLKEAKGLGLLDVETILEKEKKTCQVKAIVNSSQLTIHSSHINGYEIHMGETIGSNKPFAIVAKRNGASVNIEDGAVSNDSKIWGTYIHGIFDNDGFRTIFLNNIRVRKGLPEKGVIAFKNKRDDCIRVIAEAVRNGIDLQKLFAIIRPESLEY